MDTEPQKAKPGERKKEQSAFDVAQLLFYLLIIALFIAIIAGVPGALLTKYKSEVEGPTNETKPPAHPWSSHP